MKRMMCILCCLLLLPMICACANRNVEYEKPANFYYISNDISYNSLNGVIRAEVRETANFYGDIETFVHAYLDGPDSSDLQSYIPADTEFISCTLLDEEVHVTFSDAFSKLSGTRLSAASCALLLSLHDYSTINAIRIRAENNQLDGKDEIFLTIDDIVLIDPVITGVQ